MTTMTQVSETQLNKSTTVNDNFMAVALAALFGVKNSLTTALTFAYYGGYILVDGVHTLIADGTLSLTASQTNYIEATRAGVVSKNTTGFTAGSIPLYTAVTGTASITTLTDYRVMRELQPDGLLLKSMTDANQTLTAAEARNKILKFKGGSTLTLERKIILPNNLGQQWTVYNNTTGSQNLNFTTSLGSPDVGTVVAANKHAIVYCDGTQIVRVTPDT